MHQLQGCQIESSVIELGFMGHPDTNDTSDMTIARPAYLARLVTSRRRSPRPGARRRCTVVAETPPFGCRWT